MQFRKRTNEKRCDQFFLGRHETNSNANSVNKTVTKNNEILEIEWGNSSPISNLKQNRETRTESLSKKRTSSWT